MHLFMVLLLSINSIPSHYYMKNLLVETGLLRLYSRRRVLRRILKDSPLGAHDDQHNPGCNRSSAEQRRQRDDLLGFFSGFERADLENFFTVV